MNTQVIIYVHLCAAMIAAILGIWNLLSAKGTHRHKLVGRCWVVAMLAVTLPSFWILELADGSFSWIHGLTTFTLISMAVALWSIHNGRIRTHAITMIGTMTGLLIAGFFAMMPGRTISRILGYS